MNALIFWLAAATFLSTLIGGAVALKFRKNLIYFFAFAAGSLIAVAFLDILPESLDVASIANVPVRTIMMIAVGAFFLYAVLEKLFATHCLDHEGEKEHCHGHILGPIGAGSLILHSFLDGAAIGTAFHLSYSAGIIVALAVIFHDMTDGINTVILMLKNKQSTRKAVAFLIMDALAPVLGIILLSLLQIPNAWLAYILAFFVGEFVYIGASTLMPETREHPSRKTLIATALGIILIAALTALL
jgi:zinc transporter ZupT